MYFFVTTPNQLTGHERISAQRSEKFFAEFPFHIPALYGSTPYLPTALFINMRIRKFKSQLTIAFIAAVNHLNGPLSKQDFALTG